MAKRTDDLAVLQQMLLDCVCAQLDAVADEVPDYPGCPPCVYPTAGEPVHDSCCDCGGQLNTWIERIYPYTSFPTQDDGVLGRGFGQCGMPPGLAVDMVVSVLRCAPTYDDNGEPPSLEEMTQNARLVAVDLQAVSTAVPCCLDDLVLPGWRRPSKYLLTGSTINTPEGGCVSTDVRVTIDLGRPCGCPGHETAGAGVSAPLGASAGPRRRGR